MESGSSNTPPVSPEANKRKRKKVFLACTRCRDRKVSCDGASPDCFRCASEGSHCEYVSVRKMRGPGKKNHTENMDGPDNQLEAQFQRPDEVSNNDTNGPNNDTSATSTLVSDSEHEIGEAESVTGLEARLRKIYPVFVQPENDVRSIEDLKRAAQPDQKSPQGFTCLASQELLQYALENTYDEISALCPIFDLPTLLRLNAEQHSVSGAHPAGNSARWAILSIWIAMGMRLRTVPGAEDEFTAVVKSYYHNAVVVLPDLILQAASRETVQALLFMAAFAYMMEDHRSWVMLVTNAARQIELLGPSSSGVSDRCERESWRQLVSFVQLQDRMISERYGLTSIAHSTAV